MLRDGYENVNEDSVMEFVKPGSVFEGFMPVPGAILRKQTSFKDLLRIVKDCTRYSERLVLERERY